MLRLTRSLCFPWGMMAWKMYTDIMRTNEEVVYKCTCVLYSIHDIILIH